MAVSDFGSPVVDGGATAFSPSQFGADYSIGGRIKNWFTGENQIAEQRADSWNKASEMAFNRAEAQKSRDWSEYMAATSLQRMSADAKKSGINPLYLVGNSGASVSSGATASASGSGSNYHQGSSKGGHGLRDLAMTAMAIAKIAVLLA